MNFLRRQQTTQARQVLQDLIQKYPRSRPASDARDLLRQIPETPPTQAQAPPVAARATPHPAATRQQSVREPERPGEDRPSVITTDDLAARRRGPLLGERRTPASLPPSLRSSQAAPPPVQSAAAAQNDVRVISVTPEQGRVVVSVQYYLASQHQRPVFVGAWVLTGGAARHFGYSSPISQGSGTTRVVLSGASPDLTNLRLAFFEEGGQRFFTKDLIIPK